MNAERDLAHALGQVASDREALLAVVRRLEHGDMTIERPGGWSIARVLQHVIESEAIYAKLLAHLCGKPAVDFATSPPDDGEAAARALTTTRDAVHAMIEGIDAQTLYALKRLGHEEYSPLSVLENIALHDREHVEQIASLLRHARAAARASMPAPEGLAIRAAVEGDLSRLTEIYNHYVINTAITFDITPYTVEARRPWFAQFAEAGSHRLLVAEIEGAVVAYAGTHQFRTKAAYDTSVEVTIYCAPEATARGIGPALYAALFEAVRDEDIHVFIAGITLPNDASVALHERFGFRPAGVMHAVGRKFDRYWDVGWYELLVTRD
jgi:phosphinothricin acetyltransferase